MDSLYNKLKSLCEERGISLAKMCAECGISKSIPTELKSGRTKTLSYSAMKKISDYFGVSIDSLSGATDSNKKSPPASEEAVKVALFGGDTEVTDEMWNEVMSYAEYIKQKYGKT